eukprot:4808615-Prymnesium_polylepis.1
MRTPSSRSPGSRRRGSPGTGCRGLARTPPRRASHTPRTRGPQDGLTTHESLFKKVFATLGQVPLKP